MHSRRTTEIGTLSTPSLATLFRNFPGTFITLATLVALWRDTLATLATLGHFGGTLLRHFDNT